MFDPDKFMSIPEFCKTFGFSDSKGRRLIWSGAIPHARVGRQIRLLRSDVERMMKACRHAADPAKALPGALSEEDLAGLPGSSAKKSPTSPKRKMPRSAQRKGVA